MLKETIGKHKKWEKILAVTTATAAMLTLTLAPSCAFASSKVEKEETVYVVTDSTGAQDEVIVSDHLKNDSKLDKIEDKSNLSDIENVKGEEKYEKGSNSFITWNANGNDIYYQGNTNKEVPVTMNVTYTLNGKEVSGKDLNGKSGDVTIKIDYENNASVNGTKVPFIVMSGFIVKDDCLTDIKIDNGKIIDDGEKQVVVGLAAPGLADSIGVSGNEIGLSDSVEIKGTANEFAVDDIMTIVTSSVFNDVEMGELGDMNFDDEINALNNGSKKLVEGSAELYAGIHKLDDSTPDLEEGVKKLDKGANKLSNGVPDFVEGAKQLKVGSSTLYHGLEAVKIALGSGDKENPKANPGQSNVLSQLEKGIESASNNMDKSVALTEGAKKEVDGVSTNLGKASSALDAVDFGGSDLDAASGDINSAIDKIKNDETLTQEQKDSLTGILESAGNSVDTAKTKVSGNQQRVDGAKSAIDGAKEVLSEKGYGEGNYSTSKKLELANKIDTGVDSALDGSLLQGIKGAETINDNVLQNLGNSKTEKTLINGAYNISTGMGNLEAGSEELNTGAKQLANGLDTLYDKTGTLITGVDKLDNGSSQLSAGMAKLYNDGIKKIVELYNGDLKGLTSGIKNMFDASAEYKSFTLLPSNMDGSTKFIYKTPVTE